MQFQSHACKLVGFFFFFNVYFSLYRTAYGMLVPQPGIEPRPSAVRAQSPNHRTAREFPSWLF